MSKVSGAYPSLSRGVNQQPFEARLEGQHGEQVNMWSDPVNGLGRRRGTTMQDCAPAFSAQAGYHELDEARQQQLRDYYASYRTIPFVVNNREFVVHYPSAPVPTWLRALPGQHKAGVHVTRKLSGSADSPLGQGANMEPLLLGDPANPEGAQTMTAMHKGFAAATQVGRYLLLAPNDSPFAVGEERDMWNFVPRNVQEFPTVWTLRANTTTIQIKTGLPNRKYTLSMRVLIGATWVTKEVSYTTPSSAYSGTLDTSDIPYNDPAYQKKVNDRVNAYNSAVTSWITIAANQTRPQYIATQLMSACQQDVDIYSNATAIAGGNGIGANGAIYLQSVGPPTGPACRYDSPSLTDGGDNESAVVAFRTVESLDALPNSHVNGKIMQVAPRRGEGAFYVKAVAAEIYGGELDTGIGSVRWVECPRTYQSPIAPPFLALTVNDNTGAVGMARATTSGVAYLASMLADSTVNNLPPFNGRQVGDENNSPPPKFFNRQITWMGTFQDRLCVAAGNTVDMSEAGNYFNFFRTQTLTVPDSDPVSVYALGSESDTIRHSVIFDRSLLLFGDNQQYSIDGRNPVTPSTSTVIQSSAIEGATDCPPVAGGALVFFGKRREGSTEVFQMAVGDVADTSNFTGLGLQLSDYLPGKPAQLLYVASPSTLFVRCSEAPHSVFVFRFIDLNRQRIMDSWSRFDYHPAFGSIYGMFYHEDALYLRVARDAWVDENGGLWPMAAGVNGQYVLERQSLLQQVPGLPYLDSMRSASDQYAAPNAKQFASLPYPFIAAAFSRDKVTGATMPRPPKSPYWLHGATPMPSTLAEWNATFHDLPNRDTAYCVVGILFDSCVDLTSPVRRDPNAQPIMQGRLTVNRLDVYYKDAGGFEATVTSRYGITKQYNNFDWGVTDTAYGKVTALRFNGRVLGQEANMVGVIPITTGNTPVFVGRESKDYVCRISSRSWMPLSITRVTWTGQWFMNHRFV